MAVASLPDSITTIDCQYMFPGRAAAYLAVDGGEAAYIDNGTRFSVPYLLRGLEDRQMRPEQVRYIIVTHIHLDHSGGTAELAKHCPNATIIAHPRATRHIAEPSRLVAGARTIYGDELFDSLYGVIDPVDENRIEAMEDEATLELGAHSLRFLHTPGHAKHHFVVHDLSTNVMFTGDAFGLAYEHLQTGDKPYFNYVSAPPDFDPPTAKSSIERIVAAAPDFVCVTHYGPSAEIEAGAQQLYGNLEVLDRVTNELAETDLEGDALEAESEKKLVGVIADQLRACGLDPGDDTVMKWATSELLVSTKGIADLAERRREARE